MAAELKVSPTIQEVFTQAKKQGYPKYISGEKDYICNICGEPWDSYGISHGDMTNREKKLFFRGKGCPCCLKER